MEDIMLRNIVANYYNYFAHMLTIKYRTELLEPVVNMQRVSLTWASRTSALPYLKLHTCARTHTHTCIYVYIYTYISAFCECSSEVLRANVLVKCIVEVF
jgi:hypothetical protein